MRKIVVKFPRILIINWKLLYVISTTWTPFNRSTDFWKEKFLIIFYFFPFFWWKNISWIMSHTAKPKREMLRGRRLKIEKFPACMKFKWCKKSSIIFEKMLIQMYFFQHNIPAFLTLVKSPHKNFLEITRLFMPSLEFPKVSRITRDFEKISWNQFLNFPWIIQFYETTRKLL